ncbi:MAG: YibE/F family protein [Nocardioides sp.]
MGGSHSSHGQHDVVTSAGTRGTLIAMAIVLGALTLGGAALMWPDQSKVGSVQYLGAGVTQHDAEVGSVSETCPVVFSDADADPTTNPFPETCNELTARVLSGPDRNKDVVVEAPPEVTLAGLVAGDRVRLIRIPTDGGVGATDDRPQAGEASSTYGYVGIDRNRHLAVMTALFLVVVVAVARLRGALAVVGLVFAGLVMWRFMLPALLSGERGWAVALVGSSLIMFVVLYLAHGPSVRTTVALLGTLAGVGLTALVGHWAIAGAQISGVADEDGGALFARTTDLDFSGLVLCAVIIAGLGVLNDVTITQASAVWELRAAAPEMSRWALWRSGMRIGRDHIASTIYTIAFAYAGTSLALLGLVSLFDRPLLDLLLDEGIAEEIVRTFASGIGLVLAVPITTVLAVLATGSSTGPTSGLVASDGELAESQW